MIKSKPSMIPWDCCCVVDMPPEDFVIAAQRWWAHQGELPCAIPFDSLTGVGMVLAFGCSKYPARDGRDWEVNPAYQHASYHFDALMRHAYTPGICSESGLLHEWHAMARYMMLSALLARGALIDDRPAPALRENEVLVPRGTTVVSGGDA